MIVEDWPANVLAQQWLWGVVIGAALAFASTWLHDFRHRHQLRKIASMQIATQLRWWMIRCARMISDIQLVRDSEGAAGKEHTALPDFPFETSLDRVAQLKDEDAAAIFDLIERKESIHAEAAGMAEMVDHEAAIEWLRGSTGSIYLEALPVYERLAAQVGWRASAFPTEQIDMMRAEVKRRIDEMTERPAFWEDDKPPRSAP